MSGKMMSKVMRRRKTHKMEKTTITTTILTTKIEKNVS